MSQFRWDRTGGAAIRWNENASGQLVAQLRGQGMGPDDAGGGGDRIVTYDADGALGDTLTVLPSVRNAETTVFGPEPVWDLDAAVLLTAVTTEYRVETRDMEGQLTRIFTREVERQPLNESDRFMLRQQLVRSFVALGVEAEFAERYYARMPMADFYPAFAWISAGPRGSVMVQRVTTVDDLGEGYVDAESNFLGIVGAPEWDIFDDQGRYLGVAPFPRRFQPLRVVDDLIYGIWRDDLGVQFVTRLRVHMTAN